MKTIYLFRHSTPDKNTALPNAYIPLSPDGESKAKQLLSKLPVISCSKAFSSTYTRARQTAEAIACNVITDTRLIERQTGDEDTFTKDLWAKQYIDMDARNSNGESFRMVQGRMTEFMNSILVNMTDGESVIVVSHAAAICAYLQQYCKITVIDVETKHRRIVFKGETILDGKIRTPSCFVLAYDKDLTSVSYID